MNFHSIFLLGLPVFCSCSNWCDVRRLLKLESKVVGEGTSIEIYVKVKPNLVLEVPKDMVRRLRRGDDAFDDVRRADIQKNLLLTLDLTCWL